MISSPEYPKIDLKNLPNQKTADRCRKKGIKRGGKSNDGKKVKDQNREKFRKDNKSYHFEKATEYFLI